MNWTLGRGLGIFRERKEGSGWKDNVWMFGVIGENLALRDILSFVQILFDLAASTINIEYHKEYYSLNILIDILVEYYITLYYYVITNIIRLISSFGTILSFVREMLNILGNMLL